jgi:hypothetical protein
MRNRGVLRIAGAALLLTAVGDLGYATSARATEPAYSVTIEPGVTPRMQASEVVSLLPAKHQAKVLSLECMSNQTYGSRDWGHPIPVLTAEKIWLVQVKARFFRPHAVGPPTDSDTTSYLIDDAAGAILGRGTGF